MSQHPLSDPPPESPGDDLISVQLPREEVEALLLAVDALQPLLDRLRSQIAPVPVESLAVGSPQAPPAEDALQRVTRLARQSLNGVRQMAGERRITPQQRAAWQEAARRYWTTARGSVKHERPGERTH
jgi:hypothetical protein